MKEKSNEENIKGKEMNDDDDKDDSEKKKLHTILEDAILTEKPIFHWDDIAGFDGAKDYLKEAVILPIKFPSLFTGKKDSMKGYFII